MHVEYQLDNVDDPTRDFLTKKLVPAATSVIQSTVQVKRQVQGNLQLPRYCVAYYTQYPPYCLEVQPNKDMDNPDWGFCGHAHHKDEFFEPYQTCAPKEANRPSSGFNCQIHETHGVRDAEFVLYVTAVESVYCKTASAYAMYCSVDLDTDRPLAGSINFCPSSIYIEADRFDNQVEIAVHELLHTLVFSQSLFSRFVDEEGNKIPLEKVVKSSIERGHQVKKIITPKVVEQTRRHFGCDDLDGAELENEGGAGTAGSHWESRTFRGEVMDGIAGINVLSDRHALSPITLALLEDSGWYTVDWDSAGLLEWGKDTGCSFVQDTCQDYAAQNPEQHWFCPTDRTNQCTSDLHAYGMCKSDVMLMDGCKVVLPYNNVDCKTPSHAQQGSVDWGARHGPQSYCLALDTPWVHEIVRNGQRITTTRSARNGDCYNMDCREDGSYFLDILDKTIDCDHDKQKIDLSDEFDQFLSGGIECPPKDLVCPTSGCLDGCSGHGWCYNKKCLCHLGYTGESCALRACNAKSDYCICQLYEGKGYGSCVVGSETIGSVMAPNEIGQSKDEELQLSFKINETPEAEAMSSMLIVLRELIDDFEDSDLAFFDVLLVPNSVDTVQVRMGVKTFDSEELGRHFENLLNSGDFADELATAGLSYVDRSFKLHTWRYVYDNNKDDGQDFRMEWIALAVGSAVVSSLVCLWRLHRWRSKPRQILRLQNNPLAQNIPSPTSNINPFVL